MIVLASTRDTIGNYVSALFTVYIVLIFAYILINLVMSFGLRPKESAIACTFSPIGLSRSIDPRARGPTAIFRIHVDHIRGEVELFGNLPAELGDSVFVEHDARGRSQRRAKTKRRSRDWQHSSLARGSSIRLNARSR